MVKAEDGLVIVYAGLAVPLTVRDCGELGASSVIVTVSVRLPTPRGAKVTEIEQLALGAMGVPTHGFEGSTNSDTFAPPKTTPETCRGELPEFEITIFVGLLVVPCVPATATVAGEITTAGAEEFPVPVSVKLWGLAGALSVICRLA